MNRKAGLLWPVLSPMFDKLLHALQRLIVRLTCRPLPGPLRPSR